MWKYHNVEITPGKGFVDTNGVRHPSNWHIWSDEEKTKLGHIGRPHSSVRTHTPHLDKERIIPYNTSSTLEGFFN